jgi:hypothetical protein
MMNLKNYTTEVAADRSVAEIEKLLVQFGATNIMKNYQGDGRITSLVFKLEDKVYQLPANFEGVMKILYAKPTINKEHENRAYRITWRIIKDWIHSQLSLIASGQAQPEEVLLPYMWDGKRTLFQAYKEGRLQLTHQKGEKDATQ